ncbi:foldase protein PrsA 1 precursor [bacterium BMS3Abin08]|nr:foldase protein PrsA 1 precursor [bacterium BMS3Abin08]
MVNLNMENPTIYPGKYLKVLFICMILAFTCFTSAFAADLKDSTVVAMVNGAAITKAELDVMTNRLLPQIFYHGHVSPEKKKKVEKKALESLINEELLFQEAQRQGLKAKKSDVRERLDRIKGKYPSEEAFNEAMKKNNITVAMLKEKIKKTLLVRSIIEKEVKVSLSDKKLSDYFNNNKEKFSVPESVKLRYLWVKFDPSVPDFRKKARAKAEEAYSKIKAGEDFAKVAWSYSDDMSRVKGGDVGFIHRGRMASEVEDAAFSLKVGQVSKIIETDTGYHILKVEDRRPSRQLSLKEVKDKLRRELTGSMQKKRMNELIKRLRAGAKIEYF